MTPKNKKISEDVMKITADKIHNILHMNSDGSRKAILANLRKGIGHPPGDLPVLWGEIFGDLPVEMFGRDGKPTAEEWAIYIALTTFALHQQGHDHKSQPMHSSENRIGISISKLIQTEDDRPRITRRFNAMATASNINELSHHLRGIVQLLREKNIPMNYSLLARDLYLYQRPSTVHQVRLTWGQDFYRIHNENEERKGLENEKS